MSLSLTVVSYVGAVILFILSLGGLSNPETSRRGNLYGMVGMAIAVCATIFGPRVTTAGVPWILAALVIGGSLGLYLARTVKMTQMPELVAFMHSLVGLVAMLVGYASYIDPTAAAGMTPAEVKIHEIEIYVGVLIGAVTLSGSVIAFGKLSARITGKPVLLPARHWLNLVGLLVVIGFAYRFLHAPSIQEGMDTLNKAIQLRPDYDDAMAYMNLMYRERADVECDDLAAREQDLKTADHWVDEAMKAKQVRAAKEAQKAGGGITMDQSK